MAAPGVQDIRGDHRLMQVGVAELIQRRRCSCPAAPREPPELISVRMRTTSTTRRPAPGSPEWRPLPDAPLGERGFACLIVQGEPPAYAEVSARLRGRGLARFKIAEEVRVLPALPRTPLGRVDKNALLRQLAAYEQAFRRRDVRSPSLSTTPFGGRVRVLRGGRGGWCERPATRLHGTGLREEQRGQASEACLRDGGGRLLPRIRSPAGTSGASHARPASDPKGSGNSAPWYMETVSIDKRRPR